MLAIRIQHLRVLFSSVPIEHIAHCIPILQCLGWRKHLITLCWKNEWINEKFLYFHFVISPGHWSEVFSCLMDVCILVSAATWNLPCLKPNCHYFSNCIWIQPLTLPVTLLFPQLQRVSIIDSFLTPFYLPYIHLSSMHFYLLYMHCLMLIPIAYLWIIL